MNEEWKLNPEWEKAQPCFDPNPYEAINVGPPPMNTKETLAEREALARRVLYDLGWEQKDIKFTCTDCELKTTCIYAFDSYNTNGDCLVDK